jgi:hypothetical protein
MIIVRVLMTLAGIPLWTSVAWCQEYSVDKQSWQIGGTARVVSYRDIGNDTRTFTVDLNPRVGFFFGAGAAGTANLLFRLGQSENFRTVAVGVGPGFTYYWGRRQQVFYPFISARGLLIHSSSHALLDDGSPIDVSELSLAWLGAVGCALMVNPNVGLTGELFFSRDNLSVTVNETQRTNDFEECGVQFGLTVFLFPHQAASAARRGDGTTGR